MVARLAVTEFVLTRVDGHLELREVPDDPRARGLKVDFTAILRRGGNFTSRNQPLARALGKRAKNVVDATAGLGQDSFLFAALGLQVTAIERNATLAALLSDGIRRAQEDDELEALLGGRITALQGDARTVLLELPPPDVVYIDPMYPPKRKSSALAKKSIRWIRELVGDDPDSDELLAVARSVAVQRVIVKRPNHATPLAPSPNVQYESKLVRYDVYTP